jgi:hypothetical protein
MSGYPKVLLDQDLKPAPLQNAQGCGTRFSSKVPALLWERILLITISTSWCAVRRANVTGISRGCRGER